MAEIERSNSDGGSHDSDNGGDSTTSTSGPVKRRHVQEGAVKLSTVSAFFFYLRNNEYNK